MKSCCEEPNKPQVETVPVTRCKDCAYLIKKPSGEYYCSNWVDFVSPDEFCSRAEKR